MEPETEFDAALIDEFDVETVPSQVVKYDEKSTRRKSPIISGFHTLYRLETTSEASPVMTTRENGSMLRHYPSLDALGTPAPLPTRQISMNYPQQAKYPSFGPPQELKTVSKTVDDAVDPIPEPLATTELSTVPTSQPNNAEKNKEETTERVNTSTIVNDEVVNESLHDTIPTPAKDHVSKPFSATTQAPSSQPSDLKTTTLASNKHVDTSTTPQRVVAHESVHDRIPTDEEIETQRRQLEAEVHRFEQQASYMALALAGETPHQIEMRRVREQERKGREERRLAAVEARLEHMIERELQREVRQEERRQRLLVRTHRSSVSPSPERETDDDEVREKRNEENPVKTVDSEDTLETK